MSRTETAVECETETDTIPSVIAVLKKYDEALRSAIRRRDECGSAIEAERFCLWMQSFAEFRAKTFELLNCSSAMRAICSALETHGDSESVVREACNAMCAIAELTAEPSTAMRALRANHAVAIMSQLIDLFPHSAPTVRRILAAIVAVSDRHVSDTRTSPSDVVAAAQSSMSSFPADADVQANACRVVSRVGEADSALSGVAASIAASAQSSLPALVAAAIRRHGVASAAVAEAACAATVVLAFDEDTRRSMVTLGCADAVVQAAASHPESAKVQEQALLALGNIVARNSANKAEVAKKGGVEAIIRSMEMHPGSTEVQSAGLTALRNIAADEPNKARVAASGGIQAIVAAMRRHKANVSVLRCGCEALQNVAGNEANRLQISHAGGIDVILSATRLPDVTEAAMRSLWNVSFGLDATKDEIRAQGGIKVVLDVMNGNQKHNPGVQQACCGALRVLASHRENVRAMLDEGAIGSVISSMRTHPSTTSVQEQGCGFLWVLASSAEAKQAICAAGGVGAVLDAMKMWSNSEAVLEQAICAVWSIGAANPPAQLDFFREGFDRILVAMDQFPNAAALLENCCGALIALAANPDNRPAMRPAVGAIAKVLRHMKNELNVVWRAAGALWNVTLFQENKAEARATGAIGALVSGMKLHSRVVQVVEQGAGALSSFACNADNRPAIADAGGLDLLVESMLRMPDTADIQEQCAKALWNCSLNETNRATIAKLGGIRALLAALKNHRGSEAITEECLGALFSLSVLAENQTEISSTGGCQMIIEAMKLHPGAAGIQKQAAGACWNLSIAKATKQLILASGGIEAIISALDAHRESAGVQEMCLGALSNLCDDPVVNTEVGKKGGVARGLRALQKPMADNTHVVEQALSFLWNASTNEANRIEIAEHGGITAVFSALEPHVKVGTVCEMALGLTSNLCVVPDCQRELLAIDGAKTAFAAADLHTGRTGIAKQLAGMAWNASYCAPEVAQYFISRGAIDRFVTFIQAKEQRSNVPCLQNLCGALWALVSSDHVFASVDMTKARAAVEELAEIAGMAETVQHFRDAVNRSVIEAVQKSRAKGICTKAASPRCSEKCGAWDDMWCPACGRVQHIQRCITCDGPRSLKLYCEHCIATMHAGHNIGPKVFLPSTCST